MSKPVVAIDLDDVVVESALRIIDAYNEQYGTQLDVGHMYATDPVLSTWGADNEMTAIERVNDFLESDEFYHAEPTVEAVRALTILAERYDLYAVTGRHGAMEEATRSWLEKHLPGVFKDVVFTSFYSRDEKTKKITKLEVCEKLGAKILIDDLPHHGYEVAAQGGRVLLFGNYPWNQLDSLPANMKRVSDWEEVLEELA